MTIFCDTEVSIEAFLNKNIDYKRNWESEKMLEMM
jgi:hypothetical protein